jgi:uncharacterized LabA/DUF88 family protein
VTKEEEKKTDVHIASKMILHALNNDCDNHILVSCDRDLVPAVELIKEYRKDQKVIAYFPEFHRKHRVKDTHFSYEMASTVYKYRLLPLRLFMFSQFPDRIFNPDNKEWIEKPADW